MHDRLTVTFEALDRFDGEVIVDLSGPLTVVVGPNGSGKSTVLEAVAEVMTFLQLYLIEGPEREVRKRIPTQRTTQPSWTKAVVTVDFRAGTTPHVGASLANHFTGIDPQSARLTITRREGTADRWTLASIGVAGSDLAFDTTGTVVVDSRRRKEAEEERQRRKAELASSTATTNAEVDNLQQELNSLRAQPGNKGSPAFLQKANGLQDRITALQAEQEKRTKEATEQLAALQQEIEGARDSAIRIVDGSEVVKADVEAFCASLRVPRVLYLQGAPDFVALLGALTTKLGRLKAERRSHEASSAYNEARNRLQALLKMDVTVDSTQEHALLIDDRPINEVSSGTWCALGFAAVCEQEDADALVIWDEPETGLHPTWSRKVADLMIRDPRRFLIASHRTEFVPVNQHLVHIYKSVARPPTPGAKARCKLNEATSTLAGGLAIAVALGLEPSRILFTTNAVLWVEGPSDVIYWRFWLSNAAKEQGAQLVEGFDYSFMFSSGSLLANETLADSSAHLAPGAVNLLRLVGASRIIFDTDLNPDTAPASISRDTLRGIVETAAWREKGFLCEDCRPYLTRRVREMAKAVDEVRASGNLSCLVGTWGREVENALTDDAFRRTLKQIYDGTDSPITDHIEKLTVDDWSSYEAEIERHFRPVLTEPGFAALRVKDGPGIAQMSVITSKVEFAQRYVKAHVEIGSNLRPRAKDIVDSTLKWIVDVRSGYLQ